MGAINEFVEARGDLLSEVNDRSPTECSYYSARSYQFHLLLAKIRNTAN
jgi:hypothetical protein